MNEITRQVKKSYIFQTYLENVKEQINIGCPDLLTNCEQQETTETQGSR